MGNLFKKKDSKEKEWMMNCPFCKTSSMVYPIVANRLKIMAKGVRRSGEKTDKEHIAFMDQFMGPQGPYTAWAICEKCKAFWIHRLADIGGGPKLTGFWGSPEARHRVCPNCKTVYETGEIGKLEVVSIECTCGGWKPKKRDFT